jgi:dTDP-4-amino-4,6-dideoxygalactose transaminase
MPYNHTAISEISKKYGIAVLEDSAESLGSTYKNQKCGTLGDYSVLSFNGNKIITTSGGGALVCKEKSQKDKTIFLATQARDNAPHYQHSEIGYNYRLSNICAGIGRGQMKVLDERVIARRDNFDFYSKTFQGIEGISMQTAPDKDYYSNHWLSAMLIDPNSTGFTREDLRLFLLEKKIESRPLWKPLHMQPIFSKYPYYGSDVSEKLFKNGLCLPSGSNLTANDKDYILNSILEFKSSYK